jgi:hypothetical protein
MIANHPYITAGIALIVGFVIGWNWAFYIAWKALKNMPNLP